MNISISSYIYILYILYIALIYQLTMIDLPSYVGYHGEYTEYPTKKTMFINAFDYPIYLNIYLYIHI